MRCSITEIYDRRTRMALFILDCNHTTIAELAETFNVCRNTALNDVKEIAVRYPIRIESGRGKGISVEEGHRYLVPDFEHMDALKMAIDSATTEAQKRNLMDLQFIVGRKYFNYERIDYK